MHQCIRPRTWSVFHPLRATMDMRAHSISLAVMSRWGQNGSPGFECAVKTVPPCLASFLSQTSAGKHQRRITSGICFPSSSLVRSGWPFLRGLHVVGGAARRARSRVAGRQPVPLAPARPGHVSDGAEHGRQAQAGWGRRSSQRQSVARSSTTCTMRGVSLSVRALPHDVRDAFDSIWKNLRLMIVRWAQIGESLR